MDFLEPQLGKVSAASAFSAKGAMIQLGLEKVYWIDVRHIASQSRQA